MSGELVPEVCLAHRDERCKVCDDSIDELWVHPRDLPLPHEDCGLCHSLAADRQDRIAELSHAIEMLGDEIVEIERGMRHTAFHESLRVGSVL